MVKTLNEYFLSYRFYSFLSSCTYLVYFFIGLSVGLLIFEFFLYVFVDKFHKINTYLSMILLITALVACIGFLKLKENINGLLQNSDDLSWPISQSSGSVVTKMIHRIRLVNISMATYLSFAIVGNIFLHSLDIRKASVAVSFLIEVYPPLKVPAIVGYFLLDQFIGLVMAAVMEIFNAMVHLHIIQIYLLKNYIKQSIVFNGDWMYSWTELLYNESYQNEVYKEIIFIYRRKITLQKFINDVWSKMYIRSIAGIAILIGYLYTIVLIFTLNHFTKVSIIAMLCFSIGYPYGMYHHYNSGQKMQDEYSKVYKKFVEMPWYAWNKKNKKTYLIILTNTQIVTKLPISFNDNFNRLFLIKVSQTLYAFFNFLYKTT